MLQGVYEFRKGKETVCELVYKEGKLTNVKNVNKELLPPYYGKDIDDLTRLMQFFAFRMLPTTNCSYNIAKSLNCDRSISLFDDYYIKTDEREGFTYDMNNDPFIARTLKQSLYATGESPNTSLFYPFLTLFKIKGNTRYLLQEYSKELADEKKMNKTEYLITIFQDIPFIQTKLEDGDYFPIDMVTPPKLTEKKLLEMMQKIDKSFAPDIFSRDNLFIRIKNGQPKAVYL